jgi:hypothetical protein
MRVQTLMQVHKERKKRRKRLEKQIKVKRKENI